MIDPNENASKTLQWLASYLNSNNVNFVSKKLIELADNLSKIPDIDAKTENPSTEYNKKDKYEQYYKNEYSGAHSKTQVPFCEDAGPSDLICKGLFPNNTLHNETQKLVDHAWAAIAKQTEMSMNMQRLIIHQLAQINTSLSMAIVKLISPSEADKKA